MDYVTYQIELYHRWFVVCLILTVVFFAVSVFVFVRMNIKDVIGYLTGRQAKREIQKIRHGALRKKTPGKLETGIEDATEVLINWKQLKHLLVLLITGILFFNGCIIYDFVSFAAENEESSDILQDITSPEAVISITTETQNQYIYENETRNVYAGEIAFQIDIADEGISSGISRVELILKSFDGQKVTYTEESTDIWTSTNEIGYIENLPDTPTEDEIINANKGPLTGKLTLADGFYEICVVVKDKVGHVSAESTVNFIIDNTAPEITITDNLIPETGVREVVDNLELCTGGSVIVEVKEMTLAEDEVATLLQGEGIEAASVKWQEERDNTGLAIYTTELTFGKDAVYTKEGKYSLAIDVKDAMQNTFNDSKVFLLDYTAPNYEVTFSETNASAYTGDENMVYYGAGKPIAVTFKINEDTTYDEKLLIIRVLKGGQEEPVISWENGVSKTANANYHFEHTESSKEFKLTIDACEANNNDGYQFTISGTDKTGNELEQAEDFYKEELEKVRIMDVTAPVLDEISYSSKFNTVNDKDYINVATTMTFTMTEHHPTPESIYTITSKGENGQSAKWTAQSDTCTTSLEIPMYGAKGDEQTITLKIQDKAGNIVVLGENTTLRSDKNTTFDKITGTFTDKFIVDTVKPKIKLEYENYNPDRPNIDGTDYFKQPVSVKVTVDEHNFDKSMMEQFLQANGESADYSDENWSTDGDKHKKTFKLPNDGLYKLNIQGTDNAGNVLELEKVDKVTASQTEGTVTLNAAVDSTIPTFGDNVKPIVIIKLGSSSSSTVDGHALYGEDVTYEVSVYDPLVNDFASGIEEINFEVKGEDGTASQCKVNRLGEISTDKGVSITKVSGDFANLAKGASNQYKFQITISSEVFNTNGIVLSVLAEDLSTNQSNQVESDPIGIDKTAPTVVISYDNNDVSNEKYFHEARTATVEVTERNFSDDGLQFLINGKDAELHFSLSNKGSGNGDDSVWSASYTFDVDDEYTIDVTCKDRAENEGSVKYEGEAPQEFTIDTTLPKITVDYDNHDFLNEYYYKEARIATITIEERNFASTDVVITMTAKDDGSTIAIPGVSGWSDDGDFHRVSIHYNYDAEFTFDIEYADMATNEAEDYEEDRFVVDMTAPELEIFDIVHMSANNGVVAPGIRYYDTNYDAEGTVILMTGYHNGVVEMTSARKLEANGLEFKLDDFAYVQEMDDIYTMEATVYDLAGNSSEEMVMFSVNRFGSVYTFDEKTDALIGENGKYYTNKEQELVITETNVDTLEFQEITCNLNGKLKTLKEGEDFTVDIDGNDATWKQYTYRIAKGNFEEEGTYVLTIYSEDRATNASDNHSKGKQIEFAVDKTSPSVLVSGVADNEQYRENSREVTIDVEDNIRLAEVKVTIDGEETFYSAAQVQELDGKLTMRVGSENHWQEMSVQVFDAAGNEQKPEAIRFLITSNLFVQFFMNKPLFFGTVTVFLGAGGAWWFIASKKKKKLQSS